MENVKNPWENSNSVILMVIFSARLNGNLGKPLGKQRFRNLITELHDKVMIWCDGESTHDPLETLRKTVLSCAPVSYLATEDPDPIGIPTINQKPFENLGGMKILRSWWDPLHVAARSLWGGNLMWRLSISDSAKGTGRLCETIRNFRMHPPPSPRTIKMLEFHGRGFTKLAKIMWYT